MQGNKKLDGFGPNVFGWNLYCAISVFDDVSMSDTGDYICWFDSTCLTLWNRSVNKYALYKKLHNFFWKGELNVIDHVIAAVSYFVQLGLFWVSILRRLPLAYWYTISIWVRG